jgi:formylglycine-generating enzyme required for sulfatase activity
MLLLVLLMLRTTSGAETVTNSIGMKLVLIPAGKFMMGSPDSDKNQERGEGPQHRVRITKPFYMGIHHVTVGQFRKFVTDAGYKTEAEETGRGGYGSFEEDGNVFAPNAKYNWRNPGFPQSDDHPVVEVSWNDAVAFCEWLSRKEGKTYCLPTEAQWEYACRAGTTTQYWCGDDPEGLAQVANVADATLRMKFPHRILPTITASDGYAFPSPVGSFKPNPFGLYDMHGNAFQWCSDWFDAKYYDKSASVFPTEDPVGASSGDERVVRGGSCDCVPNRTRSAFRYGIGQGFRCDVIGFRVARTQ